MPRLKSIDTTVDNHRFEKIMFFVLVFIHVSGLIEFIVKPFSQEEHSAQILTIFVIAQSLFWTVFILNYVKRQIKKTTNQYNQLAKIAGYKGLSLKLAKAFSIVHSLQHEFNDLNSSSIITESNIKSWKSQFEWVCVYVAEAFQEVTGQNDISVCIKTMLSQKQGGQTIITFVRDRDHKKRIYDDVINPRKLEDNSTFEQIVTDIQANLPDGGYYLCNDVPQQPDFKSSSFGFWGQPSKFAYKDTEAEREKNWRLPYKSTLISIIAATEDNYYDKNRLLGFLCLDCNEKNVWDKDMVEVVKGVAEGLYNVLQAFRNISARVSQETLTKQN